MDPASTSAATSERRTATFEFANARTSVINALRRVVLAEVPYIATFRDETRAASVAGGFVVAENTGRLHNDALVDRLALVPVHLTRSEVEQFVPGSITVRLAVSNDGTQRVNVTSRDLEIRLFGQPHPNADACYPPDATTGEWPLITRLYPGERIEVIGTLEKGTAGTHAAFAVACVAAVSFSLDEGAYTDARREIERNETMDDESRARALNFCDHITRKRLVARGTDGEPLEHALTIGSECGLTPYEIVATAMDVLLHKFTTGSLAYDVQTDASAHKRTIIATFASQGHTFGSVLQDVCMRDREVLGIRSIGYYETHPLENRIVVRVELADESVTIDPEEIVARMRAHCARVLESFRVTVRV